MEQTDYANLFPSFNWHDVETSTEGKKSTNDRTVSLIERNGPVPNIQWEKQLSLQNGEHPLTRWSESTYKIPKDCHKWECLKARGGAESRNADKHTEPSCLEWGKKWNEISAKNLI